MPSPRSHNQDVGAPVEVSVIDTVNGAIPAVAEAVKLELGPTTRGCTEEVSDEPDWGTPREPTTTTETREAATENDD